MEIKAITFDFFGVICSDIAALWYEENRPALSYEDIKERYLQTFDKGTVPADETWQAFAEATNTPVEKLKSEWQAPIKLNEEVLAIIRALRERYTIALCTNADAEYVKAILARDELRTLFSTIVISSEVKVVKPDPAIFKILLERLALPPEEVLFIDDSSHNVAGAEALGMQAIRFTGAPELKEKLREMGIMDKE